MKKKILAISLVLAIALSALGVGYALWSDTLTINGTVNTGSVGIEWSPVTIRSDETKPISVMDAWVSADGKVLNICITDAYPCVTYEIVTDIHCTGSVPVHLTGINLNTPASADVVTVTPVAGTQLHYCDSVIVTITIHFDNTLEQNSQVLITGDVMGHQYNEQP
jgi:predicted ribosomally synthesized peptide with SipW-like signal peptide